MDKILMNKNNIISNLVEFINEFSVIIYERNNNEAYRLLIIIIDKIDSIVGVKSALVLEHNFRIYIDQLTSQLPGLLEAFENNDNVLISDILKYEIKPILEKFSKVN